MKVVEDFWFGSRVQQLWSQKTEFKEPKEPMLTSCRFGLQSVALWGEALLASWLEARRRSASPLFSMSDTLFYLMRHKSTFAEHWHMLCSHFSCKCTDCCSVKSPPRTDHLLVEETKLGVKKNSRLICFKMWWIRSEHRADTARGRGRVCVCLEESTTRGV